MIILQRTKIKNRKPGFEASHAPPILMFTVIKNWKEYYMHILSINIKIGGECDIGMRLGSWVESGDEPPIN